jgi:hypothetical protein
MSRVKSPQQKKRLSLRRDRRNVYGENDKASRKNVPRAKQRSQMKVRRAVSQALAKVRGEVDDSVALEADAQARVRIEALGQTSFKKMRDRPLGIVIEEQKYRHVSKAISAALRKAKISEIGGITVMVDGFEVRVPHRHAERAHKIVAEVLRSYNAIRPTEKFMKDPYCPYRDT